MQPLEKVRVMLVIILMESFHNAHLSVQVKTGRLYILIEDSDFPDLHLTSMSMAVCLSPWQPLNSMHSLISPR